jgi:hypothetical protein
MAPKHPAEWGWKVVKLRFVKGVRTVGEIVAAFRAKHRTVGPTWVKGRLKNYRETGNPNAAVEAITKTSSKDANRRERRFLKRALLRNPVQFYDQLQVKFRRKFKWHISRKKLAAALKFDGGAADDWDRPLSLKKVERIARQRNRHKRNRFRRAQRGIPWRCVLWIDESSMADRASANRLGWSPVGQVAKLAELFRSDGKLHSLLAVANCDGFLIPACKLVEGGVDDEKLYEWAVKYLRPRLRRYDYRQRKNSITCKR